jgi:hypothetical protein
MNRIITFRQKTLRLMSFALITTCSSLISLNAYAQSYPQSDFAKKSLVITGLDVIEDTRYASINPCHTAPSDYASQKQWNFGYLMMQASSSSPTPATASAFVKRWLDTWVNPTTLRDKSSVIVESMPPSGGIGRDIQQGWAIKSGSNGTYDMNYAPFILTAIVPRFDLRKKRRFNEGLAGELRFVFTPILSVDLDQDGTCDADANNLSTVILEYAVDKASENDVVTWAKAWYKLSELQFGSLEYTASLLALTESVVKAGKGGTARPNGSELIRIRTNEFDIPKSQWRLREWVVDSTTKRPEPATVKQSPANELKAPGSFTTLWNWLYQNQQMVMNDTYVIPLDFRGGFDQLDPSDAGVWRFGVVPQSPIQVKELRHQFAMGTCAGCHAIEVGGAPTAASQFAHIRPRRVGEEATLSGFMTGIDMNGNPFYAKDPIDPSIIRPFNEVEKRTSDLLGLALKFEQPLPEGIYDPKLATYFKLESVSNFKCLDIGGNFNGARLQQWDCGGKGNQRFAAVAVGGGYYRLQVKQATNVCLQASTSGAVTQQPCTTNTDQQVAITTAYGNPVYRFQFRNTGKCLETISTSNGYNVIQNNCRTAWATQEFKFFE